MKANFFYSDLNQCGGGERLTLVTMKAVFEMGIDIYLTTLEKPNILRLENAYGKDIASVLGDLKKINVLPMLDEQNINKELKNETSNYCSLLERVSELRLVSTDQKRAGGLWF